MFGFEPLASAAIADSTATIQATLANKQQI
jgi:hypothetical protein